jgi:hypothetical protein
MTAPTNTFTAFSAIGNREDLTNVITRIAPTQTPFMSGISRGKTDAVLHEWQTQDLAAAANNAQIEGDDATAKVVTPTVRLSNRTQISTKNITVSGTQRATDSAGRGDELAYQVELAGLELKRDMETALTQNTTTVTGSTSVARQLRGLEGWVATNGSVGATGAQPNYTTNTAPTDGTQRTFTEALLKDALQQIWTQGGDPDICMLGGTQKQTASTFTGNATRYDKSEDQKVYAAFEIYVSDFNTIKIVPNRFQRSRTAFILQLDMWKLCYLRPMEVNALAKTGDADKKQMVCEYTLEASQEKSGGVVRDLS